MPAPTVVFAGRPSQRPAYRAALAAAAARAGIAIDLRMDPAQVDPERTDYLVFAANGPVTDLAPYAGVKAILNLWAGVEALLEMTPPDVPIVRMVEDGLTLGMIDYCVGHALRHHIDIDRYIGAAPISEWEVTYPPLARDRPVGVLGLGALGAAVSGALAGLGFPVAGWSRRPKSVPGVQCLTGADGLDLLIGRSEILILLLPLTLETRRVLDARRLALMPAGACLINAGRGPLIEHGALLAALDAGRLRHATMDVFDVEPLPPDDPYWRHPRVTVTPHIASVTRPETAATALIAQIARGEAGQPFCHVVDRAAGY